ncbi:oligoribonuclease, mitochondrial isoform X3 [Cherax quadricarinatus]|uniref:oligoribonuclease, mitochondrial isoform X3 n=1 Tax=Cherax quadricarinatus TaxID=27406 RepID=UPI00387E5D27
MMVLWLRCVSRRFSHSLYTTMKSSSSSSSSDSHIPTKIPKISERLVWVDLEMTGLNVEEEKIMEAAIMITDGDLNVVAEGPNLILKVDDRVLDNMNEWCKKHHGENGLTDECRKSTITLSAAEDQLLQFVTQHTEKGKAPLAGNTIHSDKKFLDKYMPKLMNHLHYRLVDVSTVKELCRTVHCCSGFSRTMHYCSCSS